MPNVDFETLFALSPNPYMVLDRELRYVTANAEYLRLVGSTMDRLVGRKLLEVYPNDPSDPNDESARLLRSSLEKVLTTGRRDVIAFIPYRVPGPNTAGEPVLRYWSATHTPVVDQEGQVQFILQHTQDVTELHDLRAAALQDDFSDSPASSMGATVLSRAQRVQELNSILEDDRHHLLSLFQQAPALMAFLRGSDLVVEIASATFERLFSGRTLVGKPLGAAIPELEDQGYLERLRSVFYTGTPWVSLGLRFSLGMGDDRGEHFVDIAAQPVRDGRNGAVIGTLLQGTDVTLQHQLQVERHLQEQQLARLYESERKARAQAESASRMKDEFLAMVSHELRTPLNSMLGWTKLLREGELTREKRNRALEIVERNTIEQVKLVEDLLDVSRIVSGNLRLSAEALNLSSLVSGVVDSARLALEAKQLRLQAHIEPGLELIGDPARLRQIVWNLLANSIKFTPEGGEIFVELTCVESGCEVVIRDTGRGIAGPSLDAIFERFHQERPTERSHAGGLGLGLAISKSIAELHGGYLKAFSEGEGKGSTFTLSLPSRPPFAEQTADPPVVVPGRLEVGSTDGLVGLKVMIADDDPESGELVAAILGRFGARVRTAGNARSAFKQLLESGADVLLSDIGMPDEDGYSLIRRVRTLPAPVGNVPAACLTAYASEEDRRKALDAGFNMHLAKPIEPSELVRVVVELGRIRRVSQ